MSQRAIELIDYLYEQTNVDTCGLMLDIYHADLIKEINRQEAVRTQESN